MRITSTRIIWLLSIASAVDGGFWDSINGGGGSTKTKSSADDKKNDKRTEAEITLAKHISDVSQSSNGKHSGETAVEYGVDVVSSSRFRINIINSSFALLPSS